MSKRKTREKKIKFEFSQKELRLLFQAVVLNEILRESVSVEGDFQESSIYMLLKKHFTKEECAKFSEKAYDLIDEYVDWEDMEEIALLSTEEKKAVMNALKNTGRQGINLHTKDLFGQIEEQLDKSGIIQLSFDTKKQDD